MTKAGHPPSRSLFDEERDKRRGAFSLGDEISEAGTGSSTLIPFSIRTVLLTPDRAGSVSRESTRPRSAPPTSSISYFVETTLKGGIPLSWDQGPNLVGYSPAARDVYWSNLSLAKRSVCDHESSEHPCSTQPTRVLLQSSHASI